MTVIIDKVQFKRGPESRVPHLDIGEPLVTKDTEKFFIGFPSGNVEIAKQSAVDGITSNLAEKADISDLLLKADKTITDNIQTQVSSLSSGAPKAVSLVGQMTDTTKNYVYTGSETGYTAGNWYYWNGSTWTSGGVYQGTSIADDSVTLRKSSFHNIQKYKNLAYDVVKNVIGVEQYMEQFTTTGTSLNDSFGTSVNLSVGNYLVFLDLTFTDLMGLTSSDLFPLLKGTSNIFDSANKIGKYQGVTKGGFLNTPKRDFIWGILNVTTAGNYSIGYRAVNIATSNGNYGHKVICNKAHIISVVDGVEDYNKIVDSLVKYNFCSDVPYLTNDDLSKPSEKTLLQNIKYPNTWIMPNVYNGIGANDVGLAITTTSTSVNVKVATVPMILGKKYGVFVDVNWVLSAQSGTSGGIALQLRSYTSSDLQTISIVDGMSEGQMTLGQSYNIKQGGIVTPVMTGQSNGTRINMLLQLNVSGLVSGTTSIRTMTINKIVVFELPDELSNLSYQEVLNNSIYGNNDYFIVKRDSLLIGKKLMDFGDSIARGFGNNNIGYSNLISQKYAMTLYKYSVSSTTIALKSVANITDQINTAIASGNVPDYILIDGGINDSSGADGIPVGTVTAGYNDTLDMSTTAGSMEWILKTLKTTFPNAKLVYVRVHKMQSRDLTMQTNFLDTIVQACNKWGCAVVDITKETGLNTFMEQFNQFTSGDYTHPNATGYTKFYLPAIEAKLKSIAS